MKVTGKPTKTEWLLLLLTSIFLVSAAFLYRSALNQAPSADYTIQYAVPVEEPVTPEAPLPVDINRGGLDELTTLQGIGPALAQRILDYREENGPFASVDDLIEVKGIGEATVEKFRDHAVAGGVPEEDCKSEGDIAYENSGR